MKFLFFALLLSPYLVNGQLVLSNRNCIWKDSAILYRGSSNELYPNDSELIDSISTCFGEIAIYGNNLFYYRSSGKSVQTDTLHFFLKNQEIGKQSFKIWNTGIDTLSWWKVNEKISRNQLKENRPFIVMNESGYTVSSSIIGFRCRYQIPGSSIQSFSICDSTFNNDTELFEWIPGEYESFGGNQLPNCIITFFDSLPNETILYFDRFITICPDCVARIKPWILHIKLVD